MVCQMIINIHVKQSYYIIMSYMAKNTSTKAKKLGKYWTEKYLFLFYLCQIAFFFS